MTPKTPIEESIELTSLIREHWTNRWLQFGKEGEWREPFEVMYQHVESKRQILEQLHREGKVTEPDYLSLKDSCDRLQLELYLFLGDERQIDMMKASWDSGYLPIGYYYPTED